jgi:hypothetical protein
METRDTDTFLVQAGRLWLRALHQQIEAGCPPDELTGHEMLLAWIRPALSTAALEELLDYTMLLMLETHGKQAPDAD